MMDNMVEELIAAARQLVQKLNIVTSTQPNFPISPLRLQDALSKFAGVNLRNIQPIGDSIMAQPEPPKPDLYTVIHNHRHGYGAYTFWYTPTKAFPGPSMTKIIEHFDIDFEPYREESLELMPIDDVVTLTAEQVGGKQWDDYERTE